MKEVGLAKPVLMPEAKTINDIIKDVQTASRVSAPKGYVWLDVINIESLPKGLKLDPRDESSSHYVKLADEVTDYMKTVYGEDFGGGYYLKIIKRDDGWLVVVQFEQIIGSVWVNLLEGAA